MAIRIDNGIIRAAFDGRTGAWLALQYAGETASILLKSAPPFELTVDGQPFFGSRRAVSHVQPSDNGHAVALTFEQEGLTVTHTVRLEADKPVLRQQVDVHCHDGRAPRLLSEVIYCLPGLVLGDFVSLWRKTGQPSVLAASNLSLDRTQTRIRLSEECRTPHAVLGEATSVRPVNDGIEIDLPGAGYALIRLD